MEITNQETAADRLKNATPDERVYYHMLRMYNKTHAKFIMYRYTKSRCWTLPGIKIQDQSVMSEAGVMEHIKTRFVNVGSIVSVINVAENSMKECSFSDLKHKNIITEYTSLLYDVECSGDVDFSMPKGGPYSIMRWVKPEFVELCVHLNRATSLLRGALEK